MASSSASSIRKNFKYHVFLSFRGEDARRTFVDHLYTALRRRGILVFRDNEELEKGKRIDELFKCIEESKLFIIVFSKNYASSSWCLKELAKIMECQKNIEQTAYPLFYDVDPAQVRKQSGFVGAALAKHNNQQVEKWKEALNEAGNLVGWDLRRHSHEAEAIDQIVKEISLKLRSILSSNDENLVGMEPRMRPLEWFSGIGLDDEVRMIGIKGMGGIGKTTLARAIFEKLSFSFQFEGVSFIENVREVSKTKGLLSLQKQVLSDVLSVSLQEISDVVKSVHEGKSMLKMRLPCKKALLVLDDVDHEDQLEALAVASKWFKGGSRIIITTRNEKVLAHRVSRIHDASLLSEEEAICLFSRHAFKTNTPAQGFEKLSHDVVSYAAGLPLTIKVLGSFLRDEKESVWRNILKRLKKIPWHETLQVLEISYNGLEKDHQEIFLDVACFMKGWMYHDAIRLLESRGLHAIAGLRVLQLRSLITISNDQLLDVHDSIQEMGRDIVQRYHRDEPNEHSRLWNSKEIEELLCDDVGIKATCIRLELAKLSPEIIMKGFVNLKKLRALLLSGGDDDCSCSNWKFDQVKQYFPNALRYLRWVDYPVGSLPDTFGLHNLVTLEMPCSKITKLWEAGEGKVLKNLRFLDLSYSKLVTLDFGLAPQLEWLNLKECYDLVELQTPDGSLNELVHLNLIGCLRFESFAFLKRLESQEVLSLPNLRLIANSLKELATHASDDLPMLGFNCLYYEEESLSIENDQKSVSLNLQPRTNLESVSEIVCVLQHLRHLMIAGGIREVPEDLNQLQYLEKLSLLGTRITRLPDSMCMLKHLKSLKLKTCFLLDELPENLGLLQHLEELSLFSVDIKCLPDSICMLKQLKSLKLKSCPLLEKLPEDLGDLELLEKLNLLSSIIKHLPDSICKLKHLKSLELESCKLLRKLPEDVGQLECMEKLILTECKSLETIPDSICEMNKLECFHLPFCVQVKKLPEEIGRLKCLRELKIQETGIRDLPHSISLIKGLRIVGSGTVLQSSFAREIQTLEGETFCYVQPLRAPTPSPTAEASSSEMITTSLEGPRTRFETVWHFLSTFLLICIYVGLSLFMLGFYLAFS